jgi:hypothetical protein
MLYKMQEAEADSDSDSESSSRSQHGRHGLSSRNGSSSYYRDSYSHSQRDINRDEQSQNRPKSGRTRMSIVSNQYVELAPVEAGTEFADFAGFDPHRPTVRRFFGAVDVPTWEQQQQQQQQQGVGQGQGQQDGGDGDQEDWENADVNVSAGGNTLANGHANGFSKERERSVGEDGSDEEMDAVAPSESNE